MCIPNVLRASVLGKEEEEWSEWRNDERASG